MKTVSPGEEEGAPAGCELNGCKGTRRSLVRPCVCVRHFRSFRKHQTYLILPMNDFSHFLLSLQISFEKKAHLKGKGEVFYASPPVMDKKKRHKRIFCAICHYLC